MLLFVYFFNCDFETWQPYGNLYGKCRKTIKNVLSILVWEIFRNTIQWLGLSELNFRRASAPISLPTRKLFITLSSNFNMLVKKGQALALQVFLDLLLILFAMHNETFNTQRFYRLCNAYRNEHLHMFRLTFFLIGCQISSISIEKQLRTV